jgi:hypothetical protein
MNTYHPELDEMSHKEWIRAKNYSKRQHHERELENPKSKKRAPMNNCNIG